jgi:hypothetical protein
VYPERPRHQLRVRTISGFAEQSFEIEQVLNMANWRCL